MDRITLFCDGGCRNNQGTNNVGGWGVVLSYKGHRKELYGGTKNTTNNKMELTAAIEGLKAIKDKKIPVLVYCDSLYVIRGMREWIKNWKTKGWITAKKTPVENKDLWQELDALTNEFKDIQFNHVKGHVPAGMRNEFEEMNTLADALANKGMDQIT